MSDRLLWVGQEPGLAWRMLELFRTRERLQLQISLSGVEALRFALQRLAPQLVLVGAEILQHPDAPRFRRVLEAAGDPPLVFVQAESAAPLPMSQTALDWGALDILPLGSDEEAFFRRLELVLPLSRQRVRVRQTGPLNPRLLQQTPSTPWRLVLLGASTGGPQALAQILKELPADFPVPILVVQHLPGNWTASLAERLHSLSPLRVREARQVDALQPGQVLVVPGDRQVSLQRAGTLNLYHRPGLNCPSVDLALHSAAEAFGAQVVAGILTGMGNDGLAGARRLQQLGGCCLAEHASSCVVYGMPRAVIEAGCADRVLPLERFAGELLRMARY
ncbi:MAG: CheB methylesterase domain-containing protein [Candidatus Sericytochromatia bacterium]